MADVAQALLDMAIPGEPGPIAQAIGDYLYDISKPAMAAGATYAASKAKGMFSKKKKTPLIKSMPKRTALEYADGSYTPVISRRKSRKRRTMKGRKLTKRQKLGVKAIINRKEYQLVKHVKATKFGDHAANYNQVNYHNISAFNIGAILSQCVWNVRDPSSSTGGQTSQSISPTAMVGQKVRHHRTTNFFMFNNTNLSGEVCFAVFRCLDYTDVDPFSELLQMRDSHYSEGTTSVSINSDFRQYWSVPGQKRKLWKKVKEYKIYLKGGEHTSVFLDGGKTTIDVNRWIENGSTTYAPGSVYIQMRLMGRLSHSALSTDDPTISQPKRFKNQMMGFFTFDVRRDLTDKWEVLDAGDVLNPYQIDAPTGLFTPDDSVEQQPVQGDPEVPEVGVPDQA